MANKKLNIILKIVNAVLLWAILSVAFFRLLGEKIWGEVEIAGLYDFMVVNLSEPSDGETLKSIMLTSLVYSGIITFIILYAFSILKKNQKPFVSSLYFFPYSCGVLFAVKYFLLTDAGELLFLSAVITGLYFLNLRKNYSGLNIFGFVVLCGIFINNLFAANYNDYRLVRFIKYKIPPIVRIPEFELSKNKMIAHAGGAIEGNVYTNSLEALIISEKRGYKYIEIDLLKTNDENPRLFAAHSYEDFERMTGNNVFDAENINNSKILNKYTPLTDDTVLSFFEKHRNLWLVTDKIEDWQLLDEKFPGLKERMICEFWHKEQYNKAKEYGFSNMAYNVNGIEDLKFAEDNNLKFITVSTDFLEKEKYAIQKLRRQKGTKVMVFTADNKNDARKYGYWADMIYYDGPENIVSEF